MAMTKIDLLELRGKLISIGCSSLGLSSDDPSKRSFPLIFPWRHASIFLEYFGVKRAIRSSDKALRAILY